MFAWAGKILHVDLTKEKIWEEPITKELGIKFLGGRGINDKLLWDLIRDPKIDPLSPENVLIFGTGPMTCTTAPSSGRMTITCKGPVTNLHLKTNVGGHWGAELKFAGYDHLIFHGSSSRPVYLSIMDEDIELKDASHIWGLGIRDTNRALKSETGEKHAQVACIGPAGENLVKFSSIMCSIYNAAGRGGAGAVMGSKKVKAVVVSGTGDIAVKEPEELNELALSVRDAFWNDLIGLKYFLWGTGFFSINDNYTSDNYSRLHLSGSGQLAAPWMLAKKYFKRKHGCFGCSQSCHRYIELERGLFEGTYTCGPEFESYRSLGAECGVVDTEAVIKANEICNELGLDTISTGHLISWAMESYERGVLTKDETKGIELSFGNEDALLKLIPIIANRDGKLGDMLADGVKLAAKRLGKDSWKWATCNSKGLDQSGGAKRPLVLTNPGIVLAYAVNPRGPDHLHSGELVSTWGYTTEARELIENITGSKWSEARNHGPEILMWHEDVHAIIDSLGFCQFASLMCLAVSPEIMAKFYSLATGYDISEKNLMLAGRRILTFEKCFNVREGADRRMDDLPWRTMNEPLGDNVVSREWLDKMLDRYYTLHGWDLKTSWPKESTLDKLDLSDIKEELKYPARMRGTGE